MLRWFRGKALPPPLRQRILFASPTPAWFQNLSWLGSGKALQRCVQHGKLLYPVPRFAEGMPERPRQMQGARRTNLFSNCFQTHDADGADASVLDNTCDQSHGLITEPSARRQQDGIHLVLLEEGGNFWCRLLD